MSATFWNMRRKLAAQKAKERVENSVEKVENSAPKTANTPKKGKVKKDGK